jgi:hypothetical protein
MLFYLQQIELNNNEELEYELTPKMEFFAWGLMFFWDNASRTTKISSYLW